MKTPSPKLSLLFISLVLIIQSCTAPVYVQETPPAQPVYTDQNDNAPVDYQTFYNELSPYGQWINTPEYGYVWTPSAGADFQPYATSGHWVYSNYGWT